MRTASAVSSLARRCAPYLVVLAIGGCGTTAQDRGLSGAGIGAAAGAIVGAVTGLTLLEAAALGAAGGALTGIFTEPAQLDIGDPAWQQSSEAAELGALVTEVQHELARHGYDPGQIDGVAGPRTRSAIRAYQRDRGLPVDGRVTPALIASLNG